MRYVLVLFFFILSYAPLVYAQEDEELLESRAHIVNSTRPSEAVEEAVTRTIDATAYYLYSESDAPMVAPRRCRRREFQIPPNVEHPRAGQVLRIETGECLLPHSYYVHNPRTHRIFLITEEETIAILDSIVALMENAASG